MSRVSPSGPSAPTLDAYDLWSSSYDAFDNPMIAMVELSLDAVPLAASGRRVVELGCGTGRNVPRVLAAGAASYLGVDGSAGMLAQARARHADARVAWREADLARPLPLESGDADLVLITLVLEHVAELTPLLSEVARILAPGGEVRMIEIHAERVETGTQAHFWHEGREHKLPSFPHEAADYASALLAAGLEPAFIAARYATHETLGRCAKLAKHLGKPVVTDVSAVRPAV